MAFQDFDQITERRKTENAKKFRRRIIIAVVAVILLAGMIVTAIVLVNKFKSDKETKSSHNKPHTEPPKSEDQKKDPPKNDGDDKKKDEPKKGPTSSKVVEEMCSSTDYQDRCKDVFKDTKDPISKPREVITTAISGAASAAKEAFTKASELIFDKEEDKKAFEDCKELFDNAKEEIEESVQVGKITSGKMRTGLLNSWLSAVISYQQTCIDMFQDGDAKSKLKDTLEATKELTSNSLAMISLLPNLKVPGAEGSSGSSRRLLAQDKDGFPSWMNNEERRVLKTDENNPTPNVTVAKDDSGNYQTINEALSAIPKTFEGRYVIYVKEGQYEEKVIVTKKMANLTIFGDGSQKSIITGSQNSADGAKMFETATFVVLADGFFGKSMGFRNTAGVDKQQALAARVLGDRAVFQNCRFEGYQNTLYIQAHRQFYRSSVVSGTVDFIFGDAAAIFQNCIIYLRKPKDESQPNIITAQERSDKRETTGIVLHNCKILPDKDFESEKSKYKSYLGRPSKEYSRTVVMESLVEDVIDKEGWIEKDGDFAKETLLFGEYNNKGSASSTENRVKWSGVKVLSKDEAMKFTAGPFLTGNAWLKFNGLPVRYGRFDN